MDWPRAATAEMAPTPAAALRAWAAPSSSTAALWLRPRSPFQATGPKAVMAAAVNFEATLRMGVARAWETTASVHRAARYALAILSPATSATAAAARIWAVAAAFTLALLADREQVRRWTV